jgi:tRNA (guanine26-N2/guanine27-N2)-dimethyltransferase
VYIKSRYSRERSGVPASESLGAPFRSYLSNWAHRLAECFSRATKIQERDPSPHLHPRHQIRMKPFWRPTAQLFRRHVNGSRVRIPTTTPFLRAMATSTPALLDISATPAADQRINHDGKEYTTVKEGLAYILIPTSASAVPQTTPRGENQPQSVFYNPIQQFNRDLSVLAIKAYGEEVIEEKRKAEEKRHKALVTKKNNKRKRANDGGEEPSKIAKLNADGQNAESTGAQPTGEAIGQLEPTSEVGDLIAVAGDIGDATKTTETDLNGVQTAENGDVKPKPPSFTILDALSATGLRALRYAQEVPFTTSITANDLLAAATETIKLNVEHNKLSEKIVPVTGNALAHMYSLAVDTVDSKGRPKIGKKYDVIDLDPYGTAAPFLDAAVQSVNDGGLLCVTCTDAGVWASNGYPEKAFSLYGGIPIKGMQCHEGGLRLILHSIATAAARYGLAIEPLLSLSIDFYARVFVRVRKSAADVKFLAGKTMVVYNCDSGCGAWTTQLLAKNKIAPNKSGNGTFYKHVFSIAPSSGEKCEHCGFKTHLAGPMYAGPIHSPAFVQRILDDLPNVSKDTYKTTTRIEGMLSMALEETLEPPEEKEEAPPRKAGRPDPATVDEYPFFFIPSVLAKVIHCVTPHENAIRGALRHAGYRVTRSHTKAGSIKTDAPWSVIWEVMREWARQKAPIRDGAVREGTAGWRILGLDQNKEEKTKGKIVFDEELGKEKDKKKFVRYQLNPRENWGPMNRARGH